MKSFLIPIFLTSATLAASISKALSAALPCDRISLYRMRSKDPVMISNIPVIDHIETTNTAIWASKYIVDRKIATICKNQAEGTIAVFRRPYADDKLHYTSVNPLSMNEWNFDKDRDLYGYAYPSNSTIAPEGSYKVFTKIKREGDHAFYLATEFPEEASAGGYLKILNLFDSLPKDS